MADDFVFAVDGADASAAQPVSFSDAGLLEKQHLQEWVLRHPQILGDDLLIVSSEFDRWQSGTGAAAKDRLDVLALERTGRLIVAELKRDKAPDTVTMQALNYAAMVSRFTVDTLADAYAAHRGEPDFGAAEALSALRDWAPDLSDETLGPPGVVLVASAFGPQVTNTAMFLYENGIDIRLIRVRLHKIPDTETLLLTASQLLPVPDAEEFMIRPRSAAASPVAARAAQRERATVVARLIAGAVLLDGHSLTLVVPDNVKQDRAGINDWLAEDTLRSQARWHPDPQRPIEWAYDGNHYNPTDLVKHVITHATGAAPQAGVWGVNWFRDAAGVPLYKLADTAEPGPGE